eukprot:TRINITY_DN8644_c0_g2_i1.p1 TRINITY_DN8644_c0_g2~~TRINITY_DN8644_c0_g2_i1.p1  ORF type:complete len:1068 (+),score=295.72 TRINITY_DN8644_c0_g2_i1:104-3205(+)
MAAAPSSLAFAASPMLLSPVDVPQATVPLQARAANAQAAEERTSFGSRETSSLTAAAIAAAASLPVVASQRSKARTGQRSKQRKTLVRLAPTEVDVAAETKYHWRQYNSDWEVHKFGGASLQTADLYKTCGNLLRDGARVGAANTCDIPTAAIVSAAGGMTDALISVVNAAVDDIAEAEKLLQAAAERQIGILHELAPGRADLIDPVVANIESDKAGVLAMLRAASLMRGVPPQMVELVAGLGEVWSAQTMATYLQGTGVNASWVDARDNLIVADTASLAGLGEKGMAMDIIQPFWQESSEKLHNWWGEKFGTTADTPPILVITGFVCSTPAGRPTTLKRSGSDYSATIFAKILGSSRVTMWKNVDGVYTADPRRVPSAFPIEHMTFDEAMELAYFGGQVLHPSAMVPCMEKRIPVYVRNVFNPVHPGTKVYGRGIDEFRWDDQEPAETASQLPAKAISSIDKVSLITLSGASFLGTHGVAKRLMEALGNAGVNVILASQGSSEHSITVAVDEGSAQRALEVVEEAFQMEIARNENETRVTKLDGCSIVAVIGDGMRNVAGIAGKFFSAMGRAKVNIIAIAQGCSERNISAVVARDDLSRALRAAHSGFTLSAPKVAVCVIGSGLVGTALLKQMAKFDSTAQKDGHVLPGMIGVRGLKINIRGICDKNRMLTAEPAIPLDRLVSEEGSAINEDGILDMDRFAGLLESSGEGVEGFFKDAKADDVVASDAQLSPTDVSKLVDFLDIKDCPHKIVVDCTASRWVASMYPDWLKRGIHVVSPNKRGAAGPFARYLECLNLTSTMNAAKWHYESTVGAQMPWLTTVRDLVQTGDRVNSVAGVFSGSLSFVFNTLSRKPELSFSEAVALARSQGLTEPNPQDDLTGMDTVRKALIVGRELGLELEESDVQVESLLPASFGDASVDRSKEGGDRFIESLKAEVDGQIRQRLEEAAAKGERLHYFAEVDMDKGSIWVGLRSFPKTGELGHLRRSETVAMFTTERYPDPTPLEVRGPGAGPVACSSGVLADFLRLTTTLSA